MKNLRKCFSILLIFCIFVSFTLVPGAESTDTSYENSSSGTAASSISTDTILTTPEKAEVLNKLSILKGDGTGDYNLDGQLKRNEAATFIIRLLGKEDFVLENRENYIYTSFKDVKPTDWFASYVGYCSEEGIIAGIGNNMYDPNAAISEKAFLKLVLVVLGYEYGLDFSWSDVYAKAYEVGLVKDSEYLEKTEDNFNYTREGVVEVLYSSLFLEINGKNITLLRNLINEGAVTQDLAESLGLIEKKIDVKVTGCEAVNETTVIVNFDKAINEMDDSDIIIYETEDITRQLDVSVTNIQNNVLVLTTSRQSPYKNYTIEFYNLKAVGSTVPTTAFAEFVGYKQSVVSSDFFKISKVVPVSKTSVDVYFTHRLNSNCENAEYYTITDASGEVFASGATNTLTANFAVSPDNVVTLNLQGRSFVKDAEYTLTVSGNLTSVYGVKLNGGEDDVFRFTGTDKESKSFEVTSVKVLDQQTLQLAFNKEVHPTRAQQVFSYYITDSGGRPIEISKAVVTGTGSNLNKLVHISIKGLFVSGANYTILINEINDITRQYSIIDTSYSFSGTAVASTALAISKVTAANKGIINVEFNKDLDVTTAANPAYYLITGITDNSYSVQPAAVFYDPENSADTVRLYLPVNSPLKKDNRYKLTVMSVVKDYMGNTASGSMTYTFYGSGSDVTKPAISEAVLIAEDTIRVKFNTEIQINVTNISSSNYYLTYDKNGVTVTMVPQLASFINHREIVLRFDPLDMDKEYTLAFKSLTDVSGLYKGTSSEGGNTCKVKIGK